MVLVTYVQYLKQGTEMVMSCARVFSPHGGLTESKPKENIEVVLSVACEGDSLFYSKSQDESKLVFVMWWCKID